MILFSQKLKQMVVNICSILYNYFYLYLNFLSLPTQLITTCSKSIIETSEKGVKLFKINNKNTRRLHWRRFGDFIVNLE